MRRDLRRNVSPSTKILLRELSYLQVKHPFLDCGPQMRVRFGFLVGSIIVN